MEYTYTPTGESRETTITNYYTVRCDTCEKVFDTVVGLPVYCLQCKQELHEASQTATENNQTNNGEHE